MPQSNRHQMNTVDQLAFVKAQIATLQEQEKTLKEELIASGLTLVEGSLHRATITLVEGKESIDWATIASKLEPSRQLITAHTHPVTPYYTVRVFARKTS